MLLLLSSSEVENQSKNISTYQWADCILSADLLIALTLSATFIQLMAQVARTTVQQVDLHFLFYIEKLSIYTNRLIKPTYQILQRLSAHNVMSALNKQTSPNLLQIPGRG